MRKAPREKLPRGFRLVQNAELSAQIVGRDLDEASHARGNAVFIGFVVFRVLGVDAVLGGISNTEHHEGARNFHGVFGEVLGAHHLGDLQDVFLAYHLADGSRDNGGGRRVVDERGAGHVVAELVGAAVRGAGALDDFLHPFRHAFPGTHAEGPVHAGHFDFSGSDVEAVAAVEGADIDNDGIARVIDAAHKSLQTLDNRGRAHNGVHALPRG